MLSIEEAKARIRELADEAAGGDEQAGLKLEVINLLIDTELEFEEEDLRPILEKQPGQCRDTKRE